MVIKLDSLVVAIGSLIGLAGGKEKVGAFRSFLVFEPRLLEGGHDRYLTTLHLCYASNLLFRDDSDVCPIVLATFLPHAVSTIFLQVLLTVELVGLAFLLRAC